MPDDTANLPASIGHNKAGFAGDLEAFEELCARLASQKITAETAPLCSKAKGDDVKLRKAIDLDKAEKKRPHLEANAKFEADAKLLAERVAKALKPVMDGLRAFDDAETARKAEEARIAREVAAEAERKARAAAEAAKAEEVDPFAEFDAEEAEANAVAAKAKAAAEEARAAERTKFANADGGKAISWRSTWSAELAEPALLVAHYASRQSLIDAALACANAEMRASKGQAIIPGATPKENRTLA